MNKKETWTERRQHTEEQLVLARAILEDIKNGRDVLRALKTYPLKAGGFVAKHTLVYVYRQLVEQGEWQDDPKLMEKIRMKPVRTLSGVTTVTVLTCDYPCPGECVFCPTEKDLPKSYLSLEPGAKRGLEHQFDPFRQVASRLQALNEVGHPTDKIELLILGGSWSAYPRDYQEWFVRRCFDALNGRNPADEAPQDTLIEAHQYNVDGAHRNVGLVVETRPDLITAEELAWYRYLGVTKVQIGAQSMNNAILKLNKRGHTAEQTLDAMRLLRAGGFKVVLHWMPNLLGADLASDKQDFAVLWQENACCPDEIKIYPCQLLENSDLYQYWLDGKYHPYTEDELLALLCDLKITIPRYCRVNRVIRDIPSTLVVEGSRNTSLRQNAQKTLESRGLTCNCIRCREVRGEKILLDALDFDDLVYQAADAEEHFLSFNTPEDKIAGYLRLSLPRHDNLLNLPDLQKTAIIREVHVYGQSLEVGQEMNGAAQHSGLGKALIQKAEEIAAGAGFKRLAVISAVGTRAYYQKRGFLMGELYMVKAV